MSFSTPSTPRRRAPRRVGESPAPTPSSLNQSTSLAAPSFNPTSSLLAGSRPASSLRQQYSPAAFANGQEDEEMEVAGRLALAGPSSSSGRLAGTSTGREAASFGGDSVWVRDGKHEVWGKAVIPVEVDEVLRDADLYTTPLAGFLDHQTGLVTLTTHSYLFVWNYVKKSYTSPTVYPFPLPSASSLCLSQLVRHPAGREPGVLIVSPRGQIRFWEGISQALVGGGDRFVEGLVGTLADEEEVASISEVEPGSYILATTSSNLYTLIISHTAGRTQATATAFPRSSSSSSGLFSFFRSSPSSTHSHVNSDHTSPVAISIPSSPPNSNSKEAFILVSRNLQRWNLSSRSPQLLAEQSIWEPIVRKLSNGGTEGDEDSIGVSLEVHGLEIVDESRGELGVLVSYGESSVVENAGGRGSGAEKRRFAIAIVKFGAGGVGGGETSVDRIIRTEFRTDIDPRPLPAASMLIPPSSDIAFITLPSAVLVVSLSSSNPYEEIITLKTSARNAFLGIGLTASSLSRSDHAVRTEVDVITKANGILGVSVTPRAGEDDGKKDRASLATARLKSKLEQAIFFGDRSDNPLSFDLYAGFDGNLVLAAEQVSGEILASSSANLGSILDMRSQIADRQNRLRALIGFIGRNGLLGKLSQSSRRKLSWDAEKLAACSDLWAYQNARMTGEALSGTPHGLLADAISSVMRSYGFGASEDVVRLYFRTKPRDLGNVLEQVSLILKAALDSSTSTENASKWLLEANRIYLTTCKAAFNHREESNAKYGIERAETLSEPWTSTSPSVDALEYLVSYTETIIGKRSREFGSALDEEPVRFGGAEEESRPTRGGAGNDLHSGQAVQREFKEQLCELAAALFIAFEERMRYLATLLEEGVSDNDREAVALKDRYILVRTRIILSLVPIGRSKQALELAEHHRDFRALVELCNNKAVGDYSRIQYYIERFKEDFAFELYQWYIEKGKFKTLLTQDEVYGKLVLDFLDSTDHPRIAWIQDLAASRYEQASRSLLRESEKEPKLADKQLMLSISKLCQVVTMTQESDASEASRKLLDGIDDRLDLISVHEHLRSLFQQVVASLPSPNLSSNQSSVEEATRVLAPNLDQLPSLRSLFVKLGNDLVAGRTLPAEDLIDLLTLKANQGDQSGDYASALDVLSRARDVPEGRVRFSMLTIWRRVFIRDEWSALNSTSNFTDQQLEQTLCNTALYQTLNILQQIDSTATALDPSQVLLTSGSSPAELAARFASVRADEIELLWTDLKREDETLRSALDESRGGGKLSVWAREVARLAAAAAQGEAAANEGEEEDGEMTGESR